MATTHVMMMVRNEADRHLARSLASARAVADATGGKLLITDDGSDDGRTPEMCLDVADHVFLSDENLFWKNEGAARQRHLDFVDERVRPGDWVLSLDADETINRPDLMDEITTAAGPALALGVPLYEFWSETHYRVDGFWFGTVTSRLFKWQAGGRIREAEMGCGSEPTYVGDAVSRGNWSIQDRLHLMHWGYVNPEDRVKKNTLYTERLGGHGHNNSHVASIIEVPTLRYYEGLIR